MLEEQRMRGNVKRAAEMLDKHVPGWHQFIKPEALRMSDCTSCLLGQLFGPAHEAEVECIIGEKLPPIAPFTYFPHGFSRGSAFLQQRGRNHATTDAAFSFESYLKCMWTEEVAERVARDETNAAAQVAVPESRV